VMMTKTVVVHPVPDSRNALKYPSTGKCRGRYIHHIRRQNPWHLVKKNARDDVPRESYNRHPKGKDDP
jgi:hypothetical protein